MTQPSCQIKMLADNISTNHGHVQVWADPLVWRWLLQLRNRAAMQESAVRDCVSPIVMINPPDLFYKMSGHSPAVLQNQVLWDKTVFSVPKPNQTISTTLLKHKSKIECSEANLQHEETCLWPAEMYIDSLWQSVWWPVYIRLEMWWTLDLFKMLFKNVVNRFT